MARYQSRKINISQTAWPVHYPPSSAHRQPDPIITHRVLFTDSLNPFITHRALLTDSLTRSLLTEFCSQTAWPVHYPLSPAHRQPDPFITHRALLTGSLTRSLPTELCSQTAWPVHYPQSFAIGDFNWITSWISAYIHPLTRSSYWLLTGVTSSL